MLSDSDSIRHLSLPAETEQILHSEKHLYNCTLEALKHVQKLLTFFSPFQLSSWEHSRQLTPTLFAGVGPCVALTRGNGGGGGVGGGGGGGKAKRSSKKSIFARRNMRSVVEAITRAGTLPDLSLIVIAF